MSTLQLQIIPRLVPIEFCQFLTHVLLRHSAIDRRTDDQMPNALTVMPQDIVFETLQERLWPTIEEYFGESLTPTYSYARLYHNEDVLVPHKDRPSCEVSVTLQLGRSHHYSWPIFMGNQRIDLAEGDAVIYPGCDIEHWRNGCDGPPGYYSGQVFMHFVKTNGEHASWANDKRIGDNRYVQGRTYNMEVK
jgi:hypothetical protein